MSVLHQTEFSHPISIDRLNETETFLKLTANKKERQALAERFNIPLLKLLTANVRIKPEAKGPEVKILIEAEIKVEVVQTCVVTLDPIENNLHTNIRVQFASDEQEVSGNDEIWGADEDLPDLIIDGVIDIGEFISEQVALSLDPFPRTPGAEFNIQEVKAIPFEIEGKKTHPFASLEKLKGKLGDNN